MAQPNLTTHAGARRRIAGARITLHAALDVRSSGLAPLSSRLTARPLLRPRHEPSNGSTGRSTVRGRSYHATAISMACVAGDAEAILLGLSRCRAGVR
eukprot:5679147-Prymnesium_polylepis.1